MELCVGILRSESLPVIPELRIQVHAPPAVGLGAPRPGGQAASQAGASALARYASLIRALRC